MRFIKRWVSVTLAFVMVVGAVPFQGLNPKIAFGAEPSATFVPPEKPADYSPDKYLYFEGEYVLRDFCK